MPRFIVVTVMLFIKIPVQELHESVTASHQVNHSGHILHHTEAVGPIGPFGKSHMGLVPRTICLTGLEEFQLRVVQMFIVGSAFHQIDIIIRMSQPFCHLGNTIIIQSKLQGTRYGLVCTIGSYVSFVQIVGQSTTCFVLPVPKCSVTPFALIVIEWRYIGILADGFVGLLHVIVTETVHVGISNDCIRMGTNHDIGVSGVGPFRNPAAFLVHLYQRGYHVINTFRNY